MVLTVGSAGHGTTGGRCPNNDYRHRAKPTLPLLLRHFSIIETLARLFIPEGTEGLAPGTLSLELSLVIRWLAIRRIGDCAVRQSW